MSIRIGINGFGRMGRLALRAAWDRPAGTPALQFSHINETACDAAGSAHLLQFDSVHGRWDHDCSGDGDRMAIDGQDIGYSSNKAIGDTDWSGCDIVIESTGKHH
ncbi:MAG: glyceraldehyde 3-phosphate dehydrogenase NAD-binding domain-containing protein, partial [Thiohalocapsa sp.]